ncbi:MAG: 4'-phosphopantetheinyl transferase superfamily protein [Candidatus Endonucleobacter sp. (ex Gigantidas childressi)]|nr:4'-phosphopantetheinyl transferase superfamily protein [Candidatus Endonucleobacter sp. (ex Gigantidas childressi)]
MVRAVKSINIIIKHGCINDYCAGYDTQLQNNDILGKMALQSTCYQSSQILISRLKLCGVKLPLNLEESGDNRQSEFLAGRYCASKGLYVLGAKNREVVINDDGSPSWPDGYMGSISHSHGMALAVTGYRDQYRSIGVDIERLISCKRAEKLSKVVLLAEEMKLQESLCLPSSWFFTLAFSAKESLFKLLHKEVKRFFGFKSAAIKMVDIRQKTFVIELNDNLSSDWKRGDLFSGCYIIMGTYLVTLLYLDV